MKRAAFLIATITLFVFLLSSNFASRAGASKEKGRSAEPEAARREEKPKAAARGTSRTRRNHNAKLFADLGTSQTAAFTGGSNEDADEDEDNDPDRPPGIVGHFDEADYLSRREAFVALLRGVDPSRPADPEYSTRRVG